MTINQCPVSIVINPPDIQTCSPLALQLPPNYGVDYRINCRTHRHKWPSGNQWVGGYCGKLIHSNIKSIRKFYTMGSYSSQANVNRSILVQNKVVCNKCTSEHWHDFRGQKQLQILWFLLTIVKKQINGLSALWIKRVDGWRRRYQWGMVFGHGTRGPIHKITGCIRS